MVTTVAATLYVNTSSHIAPMNVVFFYVVEYADIQRKFAQTLSDFNFETIGSQQTDDEIVICKSDSPVDSDDW